MVFINCVRLGGREGGREDNNYSDTENVYTFFSISLHFLRALSEVKMDDFLLFKRSPTDNESLGLITTGLSLLVSGGGPAGPVEEVWNLN